MFEKLLIERERHPSWLCSVLFRQTFRQAQENDAGEGDQDGGILRSGQLFLQDQPGEDHGDHAVGAHQGGGHRRRAADDVGVGILPGGLEDRRCHPGAPVFQLRLMGRDLLPGGQEVDDQHHGHQQEGELISGVPHVLDGVLRHVQQPGALHSQTGIIQEGAQGIDDAVGQGQQEGPQAGAELPSVLPGQLPRIPPLLKEAQEKDAQAAANDADPGENALRHLPQDQDAQQSGQSAGAVLHRGDDAQLQIPEAQIADGHGQDIHHGDRSIADQISPIKADILENQRIGGMEAEDDPHRNGGLQVAPPVLRIGAAFVEQICEAPAQGRDQGSPKPGHFFFPSLLQI